MKPIELTEEHKTKLLEMAKVLFPEYVRISFNIPNHEYDDEGDNVIDFFTEDNKDGQSWSYIHWFEFCMTYLTKKLFFGIPRNSDKYLEFCKDFSMYFLNQKGKHPIDYLYEEFKKMKPKTKLVCSQSEDCRGCNGVHCTGAFDGSKKLISL